MKWDGRWDQTKGRIKEEWGILTDDDLKQIEGRRDRLVGILKERTGKALDVIEEQVRSFERRMKSGSDRETSANRETQPSATSGR